MTDNNSYLNRPLYRYKSLYKDTSLYIYKDINNDSYEELRKILEDVLKRSVTYCEARKTGNWLIQLYVNLNKT